MLFGRIQLGVTAEHPSPSLPADLQVPGRGEIAPAVADAPPGAAGRVSSRTGATPTTPAAPVTVGLPRFCPPLGGRSTPPSHEWLGLHSHYPQIRDSGLWNTQHVGKVFDPRFLEAFQTYVNATCGNEAVPSTSIAPSGWI
jgi:hypothetical protein